MNDPINALKQWLAVYDQNMPRGNDGGRAYAGGMSPWGTMVGHDDDANAGGGRLAWALAQARQGDMGGGGYETAPDYFKGLPSQPDTSQGYNRLAALMGRRF